jgi:two-component system, chemotaxis family, sensor kinase CheA
VSVDIAQFHQAFFEEAAEHLATLEQLLVSLDVSAPDSEQLNAIFRAAHSIKGGSGIFGFEEMADFTHELESLLDQWRSGRSAVRPEAVDTCLEARDHLNRMLDAYRGGMPIDPVQLAEIANVRGRLQQCGLGSAQPAAGDPGFGFFDDEPDAPPAVKPAIADDEGFGFFDDEPTAPRAAAPAHTAATTPRAIKPQASVESSSIRVSVEKTDQLINLVGELVITQAMLDQLGNDLETTHHERMQRALGQLSRNTRQLQEAAMSLRMLPINQIFSRFPRLVRDLAGKLGKEVELVMEGEHTELDKGLIEKLADPLTHIVRNSIDHGIETTVERAAAGKNPRGRLRLRAFHQGGNIVIEIEDDGRGLNRQKILAKASERRLPSSTEMSDAEVWQLIFEPGFSTADAVTDISGRGVGMDVVRRNIGEMSGRVDLESSAGHGSRVTIRLPLTLAILDGMLVEVGAETYVIPLASIVESLQPAATNVSSVGGAGQVVKVRDEYVPLVVLHDIFNIQPRCADAADAIVVLLESASGVFALQVDALAGQSQIVIKSLESNYRRVPGFFGATILGNGRVAMILDIDALLRMGRSEKVA